MTRRRGAWPAVFLVLAVAGTGVVATLATSFGLLPLFGEPRPGLQGWRTARPDLLPGVGESLLIAVPATAAAALVGLAVAGLMLRGGRGAGPVRALCVAVLAVPHIVGAASVGLLLGDGGVGARWSSAALGAESWPALVNGSWPYATVLELAWKESAFVALVVLAAVAPGHRRRMQVAATLGADRRQRVTRVFLPTAAPALAVSSTIALVYAAGSYEVAWLLGRSSPEPLPVLAYRLFGSIELDDRPAAAAAAVTGAGLALTLALVAVLLAPRLRRTGPVGSTR